MDKYLMITGCPRSGTGYMAQVLQRAGLHVEHEAPGNDGVVEWTLPIGENPPWGQGFNAAAEAAEKAGKEFVVLHQTRHPLENIASMLTLHSSTWIHPAVRELAGYKPEDPTIVKAILFWMNWNKHCEFLAKKHGGFTYPVEDPAPLLFNDVVPGLKSQDFSMVSKRTNSRPHPWVTLPMIYEACKGAGYDVEGTTFYEAFCQYAEEYGYELTDDPYAQPKKPKIVVLVRGEWVHTYHRRAMRELENHCIARGFDFKVKEKMGTDPQAMMIGALSKRNPWPHSTDVPFEQETEYKGFDRLIVIDADQVEGDDGSGGMMPWSQVFDACYALDKDVVAPLIYTRGNSYVHYEDNPNVPPDMALTMPPVYTGIVPKQPERRAVVGFGWCMIKHEAFIKARPPWFLWTFPGENPYEPTGKLGVDMSFCYKVRARGGEVWIHPNVVVGHWKGMPLSPTPGGQADRSMDR